MKNEWIYFAGHSDTVTTLWGEEANGELTMDVMDLPLSYCYKPAVLQ